MHPPGGITGGGRATAVKMCGDLGINFDKLAAKQGTKFARSCVGRISRVSGAIRQSPRTQIGG